MSSACSHQGGSALTGAGSPRAQSVPGTPVQRALAMRETPHHALGVESNRCMSMLKGAALSWKQHNPLPTLFQKKEKIFAGLIQG